MIPLGAISHRFNLFISQVYGAIGYGQKYMAPIWRHPKYQRSFAQVSHRSILPDKKGDDKVNKSCSNKSWNLPYGYGKSRDTSTRRRSEEFAINHSLKYSCFPPTPISYLFVYSDGTKIFSYSLPLELNYQGKMQN